MSALNDMKSFKTSLLDIENQYEQIDKLTIELSVIDFITKYYGCYECSPNESRYKYENIIQICGWGINKKYIKESIIHHDYKSYISLINSYLFVYRNNDHKFEFLISTNKHPDHKYFQLFQKDGEPIKFKHILNFLYIYDINKKSKHYNFYFNKYMV